MGRAWSAHSAAARETFEQADGILAEALGAPLSQLCFEGPAETLNRTDVAQPALYVCAIASHRGLAEAAGDGRDPCAAAGLSLGEYTALHLAGAFGFEEGLQLVATRGRLMQEAAEASDSSMVAVIGADEVQARAVCDEAAGGQTLVCANFNAPGQIVLSGHAAACERAVAVADEKGLRATPLAVAGAFHSPIMQPAADGMALALADVALKPLQIPVWSNVTAEPHDPQDMELLRTRLVEQIVRPVRWAETCQGLASKWAATGGAKGASGGTIGFHELAPGSVLRGLMRRIDRNVKVTSHDDP